MKFDTSLEDENGNQIWDELGIQIWCARKCQENPKKWLDEHGLTVSQCFENIRKIIWPELDDHRWHNLCRDEILSHKVCVLMGPGSSGKTFSAAWISLVDYWLHPETTCVLVSSTDIRGLKKRVWGEITDLWERGVERFPKLAGHLLDSAIAITTDNMDDCDPGERKARDMRKGLFGVPTVSGGKFLGLAKFVGIKQKRMRLVADECFPAGTMVDTPSGPQRIECLNVGDLVFNCLGVCKIRRTIKKRTNKLVRITVAPGREIICTPTHPVLTRSGWKSACHVLQGDVMVDTYEAMCCLREDVSSVGNEFGKMRSLSSERERIKLRSMRQGFHKTLSRSEAKLLQSILLVEANSIKPRISEEVLFKGSFFEDFRHSQKECRGKPGSLSRNETKTGRWNGAIYGFPNARANAGASETYEPASKEYWPQAENSRRKRNWNDQSGGGSEKGNARACLELCHQNKATFGKRFSDVLQGGFCNPGIDDLCGGGRELTQHNRAKGSGYKKDSVSDGNRVVSIEIHEQENFRGHELSGDGVEVFNLEVEGHPSYSVNGFLVHNCSMMGETFLSAFSNLNKNEDFRAILSGNPNDPLDPLGRAAEPSSGWSDDYMEPTKTTCWDTRFMNGRCVNLIGTDSPNFDYPENEPTRYKYLISREKIADTLSFFAKDSIEFFSQCIGTMKIGTMARRVLSRLSCRQNKAQEQAVWLGGQRTKVYFVDAAYGGDRCVGGSAEFGKNVDGIQVLSFNEPRIIPVIVGSDVTPEYQIAYAVREDCEREGIPGDSMGHDATGRGSLGTALAKVWSADTHPIDAGGRPTSRPVSLDITVFDETTKQKRPKRCDEEYDRLTSEFNFQVAMAVESGQIRNLPDESMEEFSLRRWERVKGGKKSVEPKDKPSTDPKKQGFKQRVGRSPDMADWAAGIVEMARRKGFVISKLGGTEKPTKPRDSWLIKDSAALIQDQLDRQLEKV